MSNSIVQYCSTCNKALDEARFTFKILNCGSCTDKRRSNRKSNEEYIK